VDRPGTSGSSCDNFVMITSQKEELEVFKKRTCADYNAVVKQGSEFLADKGSFIATGVRSLGMKLQGIARIRGPSGSYSSLWPSLACSEAPSLVGVGVRLFFFISSSKARREGRAKSRYSFPRRIIVRQAQGDVGHFARAAACTCASNTFGALRKFGSFLKPFARTSFQSRRARQLDGGPQTRRRARTR
jgi:hypothetical protein